MVKKRMWVSSEFDGLVKHIHKNSKMSKIEITRVIANVYGGNVKKGKRRRGMNLI